MVKRTLAVSVFMGLMIAVILPSNFTFQSVSAASAGDRVTDFNGDGFEDLAVGVSGEDVNQDSIENAGLVQIIYGSSGGLSATAKNDGTGLNDQLWTQNSPSMLDISEDDDKFGASLG